MKKINFLKMSLLTVAIGLVFSPVVLHAQQLFSVSQNGFSKKKVAQLTAQVKKSEISALSLTKNNESKDVYQVTLSSMQNDKVVILNEQTGANVVITPVNQTITEFQLTPFLLEELKRGVLGDAGHYLVMEATSDYSVKSVVSVSASNGDVFIPRYFYGENAKEASPKDRQIRSIFKAKPHLTSADPDNSALQQRIAQMEEEMSYYVYLFKLPDGTLCTYDEHFIPDNAQQQNAVAEGPLQFNLTGQLSTEGRNAIEYATGLWSKQLYGKVPVDLKVDLVDMGDPMVLGGSYTQPFFLNSSTKTWYNSSLWNQLVGYDATTLNDIRIEMNSIFSWYYGIDGNTPYYQHDYATTMLHEINHGLGFAANVAMFEGYPQYDGYFYYVDGEYIEVEEDKDFPLIFCRQLFQGTSGPCIAELTPSQRAALVVSNNLYAGAPGSKLLEANGGSRVKIYAPSSYQPGSSVCHWDDSVPFTTFMKYSLGQGTAIHTIGTREIAVLLDLGWTQSGGSGGDCNGVTNLNVNFNGSCDAQISWSAPTKGRETFNEDVESHTNFTINSTTNGWSYIDGDGKPTYGIQDVNFPGSASAMAFIAFNPSATTPSQSGDAGLQPHGGSKYFASFAANGATNNDWLISKQLTSPTHLSFWAKSYTDKYGLERMKVAYSTGGTSQSDFTFLTGSSYISVPTTWTKYDYDLPAGTKYIAINCVSDDAFIFMVDDITIEMGGTPPPPGAKYNVYRDGSKIASAITDTYYTDLGTGLDPNKSYTWSVKVACDGGGESAGVSVTKGCKTGITESEVANIAVYPNPTDGKLQITSSELRIENVEIFDMVGRMVKTRFIASQQDGTTTLDISNLPSGVYFVKIYTENGVVTQKIIKN